MNSNGHPRFFPASRTDEYPDFPASTFVPDPSQYGLGHTTYAHTLAQPPMSASLDPLPLLEMTGDNNYPDAQHWVGWQPSTGYQPTWRGSDVGSVRPPLEAHKHGDTGDSRSEEPLGVGKRKAGRPRMSSVSVDNASQEERRRFHVRNAGRSYRKRQKEHTTRLTRDLAARNVQLDSAKRQIKYLQELLSSNGIPYDNRFCADIDGQDEEQTFE